MIANSSYQIVSVARNDHYVAVTLEGRWSSDTADEIIRELLRMVDSGRGERCLVNAAGLYGYLSVTDAYYVVETAAETGARGLARIGVVTGSGRNGAETRFFETVSQNRGINLRFFSRMDDAHEWLVETVPAFG